jgi:carbon storage regulator
MLILSRKLNESVVIDGQIVVKIVRIEGDHVRLGIQAPGNIPVHRQEVYEEIQRSNCEAIHPEGAARPALPRLAKTHAPSDPAGSTPNPDSQTLFPGKDAPRDAHNNR